MSDNAVLSLQSSNFVANQNPQNEQMVLAPRQSASTTLSSQFWPELGQLDNAFDISHSTLWSFMNFEGRAAYNPALLDDFHGWHRNIRALKEEMGEHFKFVVLGSRHPDFFCLGGDLNYFSQCIDNQDRDGLYEYGRSCIEILHNNWRSIDSEVLTVGLVQGDALGGGFESLLSFDYICAEEGTKFGFPEQMFGLFPGMGALTFLGRSLGFAKAEQLVRTGRTLTAEELYEMGVVHILAEKGQGLRAVQRFIAKNEHKHAALCTYRKAAKRANPIPFEELDDVVSLWADAGMRISARELKVMHRLVAAQSKKTSPAAE
ncbi:crotonase/enoyl-CoA hydratase family protein [Maritalea mediterranea]|uniref:Enoyl-CoA hydratase-related protein n=1 Tax=Maritalea mediterranea TaxID=2909667 RepID=A0ABS9E788_9HYPH|nr:crotonase/enoyl-CoA hydratase family protein [Maritalea mediterranea]MCF4098049.1 enoyl-CoA hydratase-related protein [Maritalea mediterranea]